VSPTPDDINVGQQTVPFKVEGLIVPPVDEPASYTVDVGACPAAGSPTVPVTITIDPPGSVVVTISGPGGPYVVDGDGAVLALPPGEGTFTVGSCVTPDRPLPRTGPYPGPGPTSGDSSVSDWHSCRSGSG